MVKKTIYTLVSGLLVSCGAADQQSTIQSADQQQRSPQHEDALKSVFRIQASLDGADALQVKFLKAGTTDSKVMLGYSDQPDMTSSAESILEEGFYQIELTAVVGDSTYTGKTSAIISQENIVARLENEFGEELEVVIESEKLSEEESKEAQLPGWHNRDAKTCIGGGDPMAGGGAGRK